MSNYSSLKATINANVKQNGNQEITGAIMNSVLNAMVDSLGAGYQYKGVATPATNPGTPDYNVFYLASEAGTYTNFGGIVIGDNEVAALVYNGSWSKQTTGAATASEVSQLEAEVDELSSRVLVGDVESTSTALQKLLKTDGTLEDTGTSFQVNTYPGIGGTKYYVSGRVGKTANTCLVCFYDENGVLLRADFPASSSAQAYLKEELTSPDGTAIIKVQGSYSNDYLPALSVHSIANSIDELKEQDTALDAKIGQVGERSKMIVNVSSSTIYDESSGEVYVGNFTIMDSTNGRTRLEFNTEYTLDGITPVLVLKENGTITRTSLTLLADGDFVLLSYAISQNKFTGGALLTDFLKKQTQPESPTPFYGKKMVVTGSSTDYGTTLATPYSNSYGYQAAQALGMTYVNYAIGGTCWSKGDENDYEDVYFSLSDFQSATKDTTKKYLVKDGQIGDQRPWHIYQYTNGSWGTVGTTSEANGRTPLVDRLPEMDSDADVILVGGMARNDWAYREDNFGDEYIYDGDGAEQNADTAKLTVIGALHLMCRYLMRTYPGKLVLFVYFGGAFRYQPLGVSNITWDCVTPDAQNPDGYKYNEYMSAIQQVLAQYEFKYINIAETLGMTPYNPTWWCGDSDGKYIHPNLAGHTLGGKALAAKLLTLTK